MAAIRSVGSFLKRGVRAALQAVEREMTCWRQRGDRFHCPLCRRSFRSLLPSRGSYSIRGTLIDHYTANSICPGCGSKMRHRFVFAFLQEKLGALAADAKILHFAPEPALRRCFRRQAGDNYVACDIVPNARLGIRRIDITDIALDDGQLDLIVCIHVLEHIADDRRAIAELHRVLKPGGKALVAVPIYGAVTYEDPTLDFAGRASMFGIGDHMRLNGLDLQAKLEMAGFEVEMVSTDTVAGNYLDRSEQSPHIESDKYLFWCTKAKVTSPARAARC